MAGVSGLIHNWFGVGHQRTVAAKKTNQRLNMFIRCVRSLSVNQVSGLRASCIELLAS